MVVLLEGNKGSCRNHHDSTYSRAAGSVGQPSVAVLSYREVRQRWNHQSDDRGNQECQSIGFRSGSARDFTSNRADLHRSIRGRENTSNGHN